MPIQQFSEAEKREIIFRDIASDEVTHKTELDTNFIPDYHSVIGYFANIIKKELRLVGGYDELYERVKDFIQNYLFEDKIDLDDLNSLRNLSELEASRTIIEAFKKHINALTVRDRGEAEIQNYIKVSQSRPFVVKDQGYMVPHKSVFNRMVGDSHFELQFADFLEGCDDVVSYAKNYFAVNFRLDYQNASGDISNYYPDFLVKTSPKEVYIVELKGREDLDDIEKIKRLKLWCEDVNEAQHKVTYHTLYIRQEDWEKHTPRDFKDTIRGWGE